MTFKAEFIVNTGQFQHVALTVEGKDAVEFGKKLVSFNDDLKGKLGVFMAELESHVKAEHTAALHGGQTAPQKAAEALVRGELKGRVVEVQEPGTEPSEGPSEPSWEAPVQTQKKPWENQGGGVDLKDFFS